MWLNSCMSQTGRRGRVAEGGFRVQGFVMWFSLVSSVFFFVYWWVMGFVILFVEGGFLLRVVDCVSRFKKVFLG